MVGMECKICLKKFCNGKALGGHMRSHYATLPPQRQELSTESLAASTKEKEWSAAENPKEKSIIDPNASDWVVVVEKQNESESTRGRENGVLQKGSVGFDDLCTEEDVALCLVMLSRDGCKRRSSSSESVVVTRRIYKCEKCNKVFKSSQGLGSHRSSHYKKKVSSLLIVKKKNTSPPINVVVDHIHECQFCGRRFNSAQALGGHKRWHLLVSKSGENLVVGQDINISSEDAFPVDLNLPPTELEWSGVSTLFIGMHN